jgi:hypothetical protein
MSARGPFTFTISSVLMRLDGLFTIFKICLLEQSRPDISSGSSWLDEPETAEGDCHRAIATSEAISSGRELRA